MIISQRACLILHQCVLCLGAEIKMLIENLYWSVLASKLAKLNSFMKVVGGMFLFAKEGSTMMYFLRKVEENEF